MRPHFRRECPCTKRRCCYSSAHRQHQWTSDAWDRRTNNTFLQALVHVDAPRILVCAPSNAAADVLARRLAKRGFTAVWGRPQPLQRRRNGRRLSSWFVRQGGVGVLVRQGVPVRPVPRDSPRRRELWDTGRWLHVLVGMSCGRQVVNV